MLTGIEGCFGKWVKNVSKSVLKNATKNASKDENVRILKIGERPKKYLHRKQVVLTSETPSPTYPNQHTPNLLDVSSTVLIAHSTTRCVH